MFIDSHVHMHEYSEDEIMKYCSMADYVFLAVSDDYESSLKTLNIAKKCSNVIPAIGIHPWEVGKTSMDELDKVMKLVDNAYFLGEVGLDKKFVPQTFDRQLDIFRKFVEVAKEYDKGLSIHAAGAWREVLNVLYKYDVKVAIIHWYTGPPELLKDIESLGYYIGVNVALKIQRKMRLIVEKAPLERMITESDGPYEYRGMKLNPELIPEAINEIAKIKEVSKDHVTKLISENFKNLMKKLGKGV